MKSYLIIGLILSSLTLGLIVSYSPVFFGQVRLQDAGEQPILVGPNPILGTIAAIMIGSFIIWLAALIHMVTNTNLQGNDKIVRTILIVFLNILGAILYFLISPRTNNPSAR